MKKTLMNAVLYSALLALASVAAFAGPSTEEGVITIGGGSGPRATVFMKTPTHLGSPVHRPAKLKTIYNNLGTGTHVYNCCYGWNVTGKDSQVAEQLWTATPFTPKQTVALTEIEVALEYINGTNAATVTLNPDSGGVPSTKVLHTWNFLNLHDSGQCCILSTGKVKHGIKLSKGQQYWLVAMCPSDTWAAWNINSTGVVGSFAQQKNGGNWSLFDKQDVGAMALFGK